MKIVFVYTGEEYLGIEYLSAVLKERGYLTQLIYDPALFNDYYISYKFLSRLFSFRERVMKEILNSNADLIAFSVNTGEYNWAIQIASILKNKLKTPIVFGGHHPTCLPEEVVKEDSVDFVIQGEGEYSLLELVESLEGKRKKESVCNLYYKQGNHIYKNELRQLIENLDELPFPDKELFYSQVKYLEENYTTMTSRGCPYNCSYCHNGYLRQLYQGKGRYLRRRSVGNVMEELKERKKIYKMKSVMFQDEIFTLDFEWLKEFSNRYKREIGLPYACYVHPNTVDSKIVGLLRSSGCVTVNIGIESIDERVRQELLHRSITQPQITDALRLLKENRIYCRAYFVVGLPGQTERDLIELARFCNKHKFCVPMVFWLQYFPRTDIVEIAKEVNKENKAEIPKKQVLLFSGYALGGEAFDILFSKIKFLIALTSLLSRDTIEYIIRKKIYRFFPAYNHYCHFHFVKFFVRLYKIYLGKKTNIEIPRLAFVPVDRKYRYFISKKIFMKRDKKKILKRNTISVCPECYNHIPANIVEESGKVLMEKECKEHGRFSSLVEKDAYFYKRLMNNELNCHHACLKVCPYCYIQEGKGAGRRIKHYCCFMLPVSYSCNLKCNFCYFPQRYKLDPSLEELKEIILNFQGSKISFTGGEPTLREDLPELIALVASTRKAVSLATNGIKLADGNYTRTLKKAGLKMLVFSLNALNDDIFLRIEGERLLDVKLNALKNLKREGIKVQISVTLVKGVNEKELPKIYQYCLENLDFVTDLRIRNASTVGRCGIETMPLFGSEMLGLVSSIISIDRKKLIDNFERRINYSAGFLFTIMLYITRNKEIKIIDFDTNVRRDRYLPWIKKIIFAGKYFKNRNVSGSPGQELLKLRINIISWPTKYNVDIEEAKYSLLHHPTVDNRILPFTYALIENERYLKNRGDHL